MLHHRILARFTEWFGSGGGVWQTFAVTIIVTAVELTCPSVDPHGYWLLFWMTLYSGVTQPALAYSGAKSQELLHEVLSNQGKMLARIEHMLSKDTVIDARSYDILCRLARNLEYDAKSPGR